MVAAVLNNSERARERMMPPEGRTNAGIVRPTHRAVHGAARSTAIEVAALHSLLRKALEGPLRRYNREARPGHGRMRRQGLPSLRLS